MRFDIVIFKRSIKNQSRFRTANEVYKDDICIYNTNDKLKHFFFVTNILVTSFQTF